MFYVYSILKNRKVLKATAAELKMNFKGDQASKREKDEIRVYSKSPHEYTQWDLS